MRHGRPVYGEDQLRSAAHRAHVAVRINGRARASREAFIELYAREDPYALLGTFRYAAEAVAFLNGAQHEQESDHANTHPHA